MEQVGGVVQRLDYRDVTVDAEQRLIGVVGEGGEADGFQSLGLVIGVSPSVGGAVVGDDR